MWSLVLPQDLTRQLDEVTQNSEIVEIRQKEAECELEAARDRVQQQATEILLKASKTVLAFSSSPHISFCLLLLFVALISSVRLSFHLALPSHFLHHHLQQRVFAFTCKRIKPIPTDPLLLPAKSSP